MVVLWGEGAVVVKEVRRLVDGRDGRRKRPNDYRNV